MEKLTQLTNELIDWLNQECPVVAPPLEPYSTFDLSHDFCDGLRVRLDAIEQRKQIIAEQEKETTIEGILNDTAKRSGFRVDELKGRCRMWELVMCRHFYFKRAKEKTKASSVAIGRLVNRDHATVLHGLNKIETERLQHGTLLDEYYKFWDDKPKELVSEVVSKVVSKKICELPPERIVKREYETSGFMAFNGYKEHQI